MARMQLATLLTDFGTDGPYVPAVKGVILRECPRARIVDITHDVPPQDVQAAGVVLAEAAPYFPDGTLHVIVVDPGVGTERRIIAARYGEQTFLFPDNGVITFVAERLGLREIAVVRNTKYLPDGAPSMTFHGRDLFAPVAAHLLNGVEIGRLGPPPDTYKLLDLTPPTWQGEELVGEIVYVDRFGNLVSNIPATTVTEAWEHPENVRVLCDGRDVGGLVGTYGFVAPGETLALINSMDRVEVAVNGGSAREVLGVDRGAEVRIRS